MRYHISMNARILIVDDEPDLLEVVSMNLEQAGFIIRTAGTGAEALSSVRIEKPDLILLDIMLDDISGIKLAGKLKNTPETADIPIIMLTAKDSATDVVVGLSVGADDYITKPFSTEVLVARIEAVLRRYYPDTGQFEPVLAAGSIKVFPDSVKVTVDGRVVDLTAGEYKILTALIEAAGKAMSRDQLLGIVADGPDTPKIRIVDVQIATLRKKLGDAGKMIKTIHGRGYRIDF